MSVQCPHGNTDEPCDECRLSPQAVADMFDVPVELLGQPSTYQNAMDDAAVKLAWLQDEMNKQLQHYVFSTHTPKEELLEVRFTVSLPLYAHTLTGLGEN